MKRSLGKAVKFMSLFLFAMILSVMFRNQVFAMGADKIEPADNSVYAGSISVKNEATGEIIEIPMTKAEQSAQLCAYNDDGTITETHEAIVAISKDGKASYVDHVPPMTRSESTGADSNTYWKASVTITYSVNASTASLTKVSGYWSQLRGNTTLSGRKVYYAINAGTSGYSDTKYPTSNTFSYNTGFGSLSSARLYSIGANSSATITTEAGLNISITANVEKKYTS